MWSKAYRSVAAVVLSSGILAAQDQSIPQSAVKIDLGNSSPLSMVNSVMADSRATARGAALVLDLHMSLMLRNGSSKHVHGVTLRVVAQEATLGGKGSVTYPTLNIGPGDNFPVRIDMQLMKPSQMVGGPLVQVDLDGVLFQDLSFSGPAGLNPRRTMTAYEMQARRDRDYFKRVFAQSGRDGLQREMLESLNRQAGDGQLTVAVSRSGRAVTSAAVAERTA